MPVSQKSQELLDKALRLRLIYEEMIRYRSAHARAMESDIEAFRQSQGYLINVAYQAMVTADDDANDALIAEGAKELKGEK